MQIQKSIKGTTNNPLFSFQSVYKLLKYWSFFAWTYVIKNKLTQRFFSPALNQGPPSLNIGSIHLVKLEHIAFPTLVKTIIL